MKRATIISTPEQWEELLGIAYADRGMDFRTGLNCYGLVREWYRLLSIDLPVRDEMQLTAMIISTELNTSWRIIDEPLPHAVAVMKQGKRLHLGVVTPELQIMHADRYVGEVIRTDIKDLKSNILYYLEYTGEGGDAAIPQAEDGIGKILVGIVSIAASILLPPLVGVWATAGIVLGLNVVSSLLFPMKPMTPNFDGMGNSIQYGWRGVRNETMPGLPMGMPFGRVKVGGQVVNMFTHYDSAGDEWLNMLVCPGKGAITRFEDIRINDTSIQYFPNAIVAVRPGDEEQAVIPGFEQVHTQYPSGAVIPYDASADAPNKFIAFSTKQPVEGVKLTIFAPQGLYEIDEEDGTAMPRSVDYRIDYKPSSETVWQRVPAGRFVFSNRTPFKHRMTGVFTGTANPYTLTDGSIFTFGAWFSHTLDPGQHFELIVDGSTYYCTHNGGLGDILINFDAFTDSGRTTPKTGAFTDGEYIIQGEDIHYSVAGYTSDRPMTGFDTDIETSGMKFTLSGSPLNTWSRADVYYRAVGASSWQHTRVELGTWLDTLFGSAISPELPFLPPIREQNKGEVLLSNLPYDYYQVRIVWSNDQSEPTPEWPFPWPNPLDVRDISGIMVSDLYLNQSYTGEFTIGAGEVPTDVTAQEPKILSLPYDWYDFRIWRTTVDHETMRWQDDIALESMDEIINTPMAYPGCPLIGIQVKATDRLSGSLPKVTATIVGAPLSVPGEADRTGTTITDDLGLITTNDVLVSGVVVTGMRKVQVLVALPDYDGGYFWLVRMASSGFAQEDRQLTKYTQRVHVWGSDGGTGTYLYLQSTEGFADGEEIMLFHEDKAPVDNLAWACTKMLLDGSHERITSSQIAWDDFAEWDAWNREQKTDPLSGRIEDRHTYHALVDFSSDLGSVVLSAANTGRGIPYKEGNIWRLWVDKAKAPARVFTEAGNCNSVEINPIPSKGRANILTARFWDAAMGYRERMISEADVQQGERRILAELPPMVGVTSERQIRALLKYHLAVNRYVEHNAKWAAGYGSLGCGVGDTTRLQSQAINYALGGRIKALTAGAVELDQSFTPAPETTYRLTIWGSDDQDYIWEGTLTGENISTVPAPSEFTMADPYENNYLLQTLTDSAVHYRVINIQRDGETLHASIGAMEYRSEVYQND